MSAIPKPASVANPYAPPRARVRDVVSRTRALVPAERSTRFFAMFVDGFIFSAMVYSPVAVGMAIAAASGEANSDAAGIFVLGGFALTLVMFFVWLWLTLKQMNETGQSLAKKYFNIKVVRSDGSPATLSTLIWKRNVINWLLGIIPLYALVEVLFIFGEERQCLHDKIADTIVVEA